MKSVKRKIIKIGNSCGFRLYKEEMQKYNLQEGDTVLLEEDAHSITIRMSQATKKLSLAETVAQAAKEDESWDEFDTMLSDGLEDL